MFSFTNQETTMNKKNDRPNWTQAHEIAKQEFEKHPSIMSLTIEVQLGTVRVEVEFPRDGEPKLGTQYVSAA